MKPIKLALWGLLAGLSVLWLAGGGLPDTSNFMGFRSWLVQYSGVIAIGAMSVAVVLAARLNWLEQWLNGLDKSYRLHKWLGIAALVAAVTHWAAKQSPGWLGGLGLLGERGPRPDRGEMPVLTGFKAVLADLRDPAEWLGEWMFYGVVALIVIALIKLVPYRWFAKTHTLIAPAYLALVFHAVVLMDFDLWLHPVGMVTAVLMAAGSLAAVLVLFRRVSKRATASGHIEKLHYTPGMKTLETTLSVDDNWKGHKPGQFAFVTFDKSEGAHPFTLASAWDEDTPQLTFLTKGLGDYTNGLHETLAVGQPVTVEGPYGGFTFESDKTRQIWIGGGIGITPFIARMKHLAKMPTNMPIDLIHTATEMDADTLERLEADAHAAGVTLRVLLDNRDGRLTGERLRSMIPNWTDASVWFCGPAAFGDVLGRDLKNHGLAPSDYHRELFQMR